MGEFFRRYRTLTFAIAAVFLVSFLATAGVLWWRGEEAKPPATPQEHEPNTPVIEQPNEEPDTTITPKTEIMRRIIYTECGDAEVVNAQACPEEVGLTAVEFGAQNPGWEINNFNPETVLITKEEPGLCKDHQQKSYLGVKKGYVTIFAGVPGLSEVVREVTNIKVESLPEDLQTKLEQGMDFRYYLGIKDQSVAIFFGTPVKKDLILYKKTEYEIANLPAQEVDDLKKYIEVKSRNELENVLESYAELTGDF